MHVHYTCTHRSSKSPQSSRSTDCSRGPIQLGRLLRRPRARRPHQAHGATRSVLTNCCLSPSRSTGASTDAAHYRPRYRPRRWRSEIRPGKRPARCENTGYTVMAPPRDSGRCSNCALGFDAGAPRLGALSGSSSCFLSFEDERDGHVFVVRIVLVKGRSGRNLRDHRHVRDGGRRWFLLSGDAVDPSRRGVATLLDRSSDLFSEAIALDAGLPEGARTYHQRR